MIEFEKLEVTGWEAAIRGMRNAMNSWDKMDSFDCRSQQDHCWDCIFQDERLDQECPGVRFFNGNSNMCGHIGPNDHELMMKLRNAGTDHRKFMRAIHVSVDITAPLYWWKEFDTYKIGTTSLSCSTMHKIHEKEFTLEDFSHEKLLSNIDYHRMVELNGCCTEINVLGYASGPLEDLQYDIDKLNVYRKLFNQTKDKFWWEQIIQRLPSSYNQKRTIDMNYENLANMYGSRKFHKLDEWRELCAWAETLPYSEIITGKMEVEK